MYRGRSACEIKILEKLKVNCIHFSASFAMHILITLESVGSQSNLLIAELSNAEKNMSVINLQRNPENQFQVVGLGLMIANHAKAPVKENG
jgi:hypothetical protein